ncbi:sensor histidine kinase [Nocardiopsis changdeensis]|uniref:histidine kinase n=1 Tax=Nocardiopsis changdeensis TaxID=2831969 RepID=A0ABX8BF64_9ACTN|nr:MULTISPECIES: histidine kinase [Nocardiopsis]QUX20694.1 sensor histidine kinase [Nocardiopsis changdeensis]QYX36626.1 sensor histidine kinase [Nocardiopsis sp. MT53]
MDRPPGGPLLAVARPFAQGAVRSSVLLVLTAFVPGIWVAAAFFFLRLTGSAFGTFWCVFGVAVPCLVVFPRPVCGAVRSLVLRWTGTAIPDSYRPLVPVTRMATRYWWNGYDYQRFRWVSLFHRWILSRVYDPAAWRDMLWLLAAPFTAGAAAAAPLALTAAGAAAVVRRWSPPPPVPDWAGTPVAVAVALLGVLLLPVGWRVAVPSARRLLGPSAPARFAARIAALVQGRADLTHAQEAELRRIERDLHDGAQARLVSIGLSLSAAERLLDDDQTEVRELLRQTRENSLAALRELRELARGIVPPVLAERGLVDAIRALALDAPLRTEVRSTLEHRLETPIESGLYFATAELVTNAVKHSHGSAIDITIDRTRQGVAVTVADDGRGGARAGAGSGLAGLRTRLNAFDGVLRIDSPPGGPTRITVEVPCASS